MTTTTQIEIASRRLYGPGGLAATNIKFTPGSNPHVSAEQIAEQINNSITRIEAGDYEVRDLDAESD